MEQLHKLEATILGWIKNVPHLPVGVRKWLGENSWWVVLTAVIISTITILLTLLRIMADIELLSSPAYYLTPFYASPWAVATRIVALVFATIVVVLMAVAVKPLRGRTKKGWVLLFLAWLVGIFGVVVNAILSLSPVGFIFDLLFGAIFAGLVGYLLFEMHSQFAHDKAVAHKASK